MKNKKVFSLDYAGKELSFEVSDLAQQANAAVIGRYGDSAILATVVMGKEDVNLDYFPLRVEYEERFYAIGKILGSRFMRRESRPSEEAVLAGRVVDRVIRPLFDERLRREIQVVITVLSLDEEHDPDFLSLITASLALSISSVPWAGPVAGIKIANGQDQSLVNPNNSQLKEGFRYSTFVAGTKDRINMIELEGIEVQEDEALATFEKAQAEISQLIDFQLKIQKEIGKEKETVALNELSAEQKQFVRTYADGKIEGAVFTQDKAGRETNISALNKGLKEELEKQEVEEDVIKLSISYLDEVINEYIHEQAIKHDRRPDGRAIDAVRPLQSEVGLLKRAHGSALFARGLTQALSVVTIAPPGSEQLVETIEFSGKKRFLLHYNFPPYSVGEVGFFRGPGRREIGHGALAQKAIVHMLPDVTEFPYTLRAVTEILSSNGSSSMATVCATTLSLMDAGVPIKKPVAGIAMGLMSNKEGEYKVLTDLQGTEDHFGDTDLKVAGTKDGITAMQMDVKIEGLTIPMLKDGLDQAKKARLEILDHIATTLAAPRPELSPLAPLVLIIKIDPSQIGEVIGPGGKVINGIIEKTGAESIDIEEDGTVFVAGKNKEIAEAALAEVKSITKGYAVGEIVEGPIVRILEFGAIVDLGGGKDGMIHVSELKDGFVKKVEDVVKMGDVVKAKVVKVDNGKIGLSLKAMAKEGS
ncbi:MAG: polyribonucleotide nucleotidyltransferase [Candidatus Harrisonbacteria bacterium CG10_big_fil_rev_8_21_14_0_10_44_23]|uniref:Polyribonucleotide nucleotidyltransferase n=1 Tax=Candidatus Harrisonbacteria bacterium CG10_big_fil_rev_8_21_14_0_10_44_23 TaxID=1974585 RepID=A0A2H0UQV6_9BACT|nr:MAG: polyribonucleotide nucleotidyltransferase [Candidatus Harrisonbacteria bacterium CG10_big_fil_rev_8_21_14_0_10_44_23]